jgi:hypothetical protein
LDITPELAAATKALSPAVKRLSKVLEKLALDKLPIGAVADSLYDMKQLSKMLNALTAPFEDLLLPSVKTTEEHFIQKLAVGEASGVQGHKSRVQITDSVIPVVKDWPKFYAHIKKTGSFELLNRAPNKTAIVERWDAKKEVPGIDKFHAKKVSCTKLGGK